MIIINKNGKFHRKLENDSLFDNFAPKFASEGFECFLIPSISFNFTPALYEERSAIILDGEGKEVSRKPYQEMIAEEKWVDVDEAIYTKAVLRQMRRARSFANVPEVELMLAKTAGTPTDRQITMISDQALDYISADDWYNELKVRNLSRVSEMTVEEIETFASEIGHTLKGSTKAAKLKSLTGADLI